MVVNLDVHAELGTTGPPAICKTKCALAVHKKQTNGVAENLFRRLFMMVTNSCTRVHMKQQNIPAVYCYNTNKRFLSSSSAFGSSVVCCARFLKSDAELFIHRLSSFYTLISESWVSPKHLCQDWRDTTMARSHASSQSDSGAEALCC